MAAEGRGTDPPLEEVLFNEGYRFDFFQAVRVLERLSVDRSPVGQDADPSQEIVRFRSLVSLSFPPSAIHEIIRPEGETGPAHMTVAFFGLVGPLGVLPRHYTELLLERLRRKDSALRDFLDLFHHRLISFFYRAWEKYRVPLAYERTRVARQGSAAQRYDRFSLAIFALIGMGAKGLRGRLAVPDDTLLFYSGLLAQRPRSASALEGLLQDYFRVPVAVVQFVGRWLPLSDDNRSCLGARGQNNLLGVTTFLGRRVWDQQAAFRLRLGPLTRVECRRLLPTGHAFRALLQLARFFAGQEFAIDVELVLNASEASAWRLGGQGDDAPRLGWSTWFVAKEWASDDANLVIHLTEQKASAVYPPLREARAAA